MKRNRALSVVLALALAFTTLFSGGAIFTWDASIADEVYANDFDNGAVPDPDAMVSAANSKISAYNEVAAAAEKQQIDLSTDRMQNAWTVAIYMCATDLESKYGCGTMDLCEMLDATIPDGVNLIVLTGGAEEWKDYEDIADYRPGKEKPAGYEKPTDGKTQIWFITDDEMVEIYQYDEYMNLSSDATVENFFTFAQMLAPAEHFFAEFWDHGGGPIGGAENAYYDGNTWPAITVPEIKAALERSAEVAQWLREDEPWYDRTTYKYDLIGFDNCLMSSVEVAYELKDLTDYFVVSEETEPGTGWDYLWLNVFTGSEDGTTNPVYHERNAVEVGTRIIDLFPMPDTNWSVEEGREKWVSEGFEEYTLALIDMDKVGVLKSAFDSLGDALNAIYDDDNYMEYYLTLASVISDLPTMHDGSLGLVDSYKFAKTIQYYVLEMDPELQDQKLLDIYNAAEAIMANAGRGSFDPAHPEITSRGEIGNLEPYSVEGDHPENFAVKYRGIATSYSGGNGITIFFPGFAKLSEDNKDAVINEKGETGAYINSLAFCKDGETNGYADFITKLVKDSYTGTRFKFEGDLKAERVKEDGYDHWHITADKQIERVIDLNATYSLLDEKENEYLLGSLPGFYERDDKGEKHFDVSAIVPMLYVGDSKDDIDFVSFDIDYNDKVTIPAFAILNDKDKEVYNGLKASTIDGFSSYKEVDPKYLKFFVCDFDGEPTYEEDDKEYQYPIFKLKVESMWDYTVTTDANGKENLAFNQIPFEGLKDFTYYPVMQVKAKGSEDPTCVFYDDVIEGKAFGAHTFKPSAQNLIARSMSLTDNEVAEMGYTSRYVFTDYDVYFNGKSVEVKGVAPSPTPDPSPSGGGSGSGSGSGGSSSSTTVKNADGSTTTTVTTKTANGTVTTTTTKNPDGSVVKKKVVENKDGSKVVTETTITAAGTETVVEVATDKDGKVTEVTTSITNSKGVGMTASYTASGSNLTLKKIETKGKTSVSIPATIKCDGKTYKVTKVGAAALKGNKDVKTLSVGKNVKSIGKNAFNGASKLKTVTIKGKVTSVGKNAFAGINKKATIKIDATKKVYKTVKKAVAKSGVAKTVKYKRV